MTQRTTPHQPHASVTTIDDYQQPRWVRPYGAGTRVGRAQAIASYAAYYGLDGSADDDPSVEERLPYIAPPMIAYASRTGTRRNLEAMRAAGWRLLVSAKGVLRTEGMRYALDNGAWSSFQQGLPFDERAFAHAVDRLGEEADWIVLPDIVAGGAASLDFSLKWLKRLEGLPTPLLLAVQNGMTADMVRDLLSPSLGIFVGGDTTWKLATVSSVWGPLARRRNCVLHVGRVNSAKRIALCAAAGATSVDGTSATRYEKNLAPLNAALLHHAVNQQDMFNPRAAGLQDLQQLDA